MLLCFLSEAADISRWHSALTVSHTKRQNAPSSPAFNLYPSSSIPSSIISLTPSSEHLQTPERLQHPLHGQTEQRLKTQLRGKKSCQLFAMEDYHYQATGLCCISVTTHLFQTQPFFNRKGLFKGLGEIPCWASEVNFSHGL